MRLKSVIVFRHDFTKLTWSKNPLLSTFEAFKIEFVISDNNEIALIT